MLPPIFFSVNTLKSGILSEAELDNILELSLREAQSAKLIGGTSTSLEKSGTVVQYRLMNGAAVAEHLPDLQRLYETTFRQLAQRAFDVELEVSPNVISGVNVNVLDTHGGRYEWHYDSNPYTGLLVLTDTNADKGGRLLFGRGSDQVPVSVARGDLLFFDARETAHAVEPITGDWARVSAPMNYFISGQPIERPGDLDSTLYGEIL